MYCEAWANKRWMAMVERRGKREEARGEAKEKDKEEQARLFAKAAIDDDLEDVTLNEAGEQDGDFVASEEIFDEENNDGQVQKKRKRALNSEKKTKSLQDMPEDWQHLRHSVWSVREEYYRAVDLMISKYHMSYDQGVGAVVTVGCIMFGLDWKLFEEGSEITVHTVPDKRMNRRMAKALEASTLSEIVAMMMDEESTTVTYHDQCSAYRLTIYRDT